MLFPDSVSRAQVRKSEALAVRATARMGAAESAEAAAEADARAARAECAELLAAKSELQARAAVGPCPPRPTAEQHD